MAKKEIETQSRFNNKIKTTQKMRDNLIFSKLSLSIKCVSTVCISCFPDVIYEQQLLLSTFRFREGLSILFPSLHDNPV